MLGVTQKTRCPCTEERDAASPEMSVGALAAGCQRDVSTGGPTPPAEGVNRRMRRGRPARRHCALAWATRVFLLSRARASVIVTRHAYRSQAVRVRNPHNPFVPQPAPAESVDRLGDRGG